MTESVVTIPDHAGRPRPYRLARPDPGPLCRWAGELTRTDGTRRPRLYSVRLLADGWRCDCPDATVGDARKRGWHCKHVVACAEIARREGIVSEQEVKARPAKDRGRADEAAAGIVLGDRAVSSDSISRLVPSLVKARAEMRNVGFDRQNTHLKNRYASLPATIDAVRDVFARHGLTALQMVITGDRGPLVTTLVVHESGEWLLAGELELPATKADAQAWGSAITYARRYLLQAAAGVAADDDDDDGNAASSASAARPAHPPAARGVAGQAVPPARPADPGDVRQVPNPFSSQGHKKAVAYEAQLVGQGLCQAGELVDWLQHAVTRDLARWDEPDLQPALREQTVNFKREAERQAGRTPSQE